jgi:hypothetical protein
MNFEEEMIQEAIMDGHCFIILEPRSVFDPAIKEFHKKEGRLVYDIETLLLCLSKEYGWDAVGALEWFDYNIYSLTHMDGGPIFYDEFDQVYLTLEEEHVTLLEEMEAQ